MFFRSIFCTSLFIIVLQTAVAQNWYIGALAGGCNYQGELQSRNYNLSQMHLAVGLGVAYKINDRWAVRAEWMKGHLSGRDSESDNPFAISRNLSFETSLNEFALRGEFYFKGWLEGRIRPYLFGGIASFHIDPYAYDVQGQKQYLFPLATEGRGLPQYPDREAAKRNNLSIPVGGGVLYALSDRWFIGVEVGTRKTYIDYIDDVSGTYVDQAVLLAERGPTAVAMAYRGGELPGGSGYPAEGAPRGSSIANEWYYNTIFRIQYRINRYGSMRERANSCPKF